MAIYDCMAGVSFGRGGNKVGKVYAKNEAEAMEIFRRMAPALKPEDMRVEKRARQVRAS